MSVRAEPIDTRAICGRTEFDYHDDAVELHNEAKIVESRMRLSIRASRLFPDLPDRSTRKCDAWVDRNLP